MTGVIVVRDGKGRKDRVVPVHPDLAAELRTWVLPDGARYIDITAGRLGRIPPRSSRSPATTAEWSCCASSAPTATSSAHSSAHTDPGRAKEPPPTGAGTGRRGLDLVARWPPGLAASALAPFLLALFHSAQQMCHVGANPGPPGPPSWY